jgi:hypothetical protein
MTQIERARTLGTAPALAAYIAVFAVVLAPKGFFATTPAPQLAIATQPGR